MRKLLRFFAASFLMTLFGVAVALMPGCSYRYTYEISGTVKNAADGSTLQGVHIAFNTETINSDEPGQYWISKSDGSFSASYKPSSSQKQGKQTLKLTATLSRDGFITEIIDLGTHPLPESSQAKPKIIIAAYLRPEQTAKP